MAVPDNALGIGVRADVSPAAHSLASSAPEHFVQFYREDEELIGSVAKYVREGMEGGAAAVVIAAEPHTTALEERLRADGIDTAKARRGRQLLLLDAGETLATFMVDGVPDRELFLAKVGGIISAAIGRHGRVLAFGEMVALLWKEGRTEAAIELERLWNELARRQTFTLFCAYPLQDCGRADHLVAFEKVCASHTRVIPVGHPDASRDQLGQIARLQQKALVLEGLLARELEVQQSLAQLAAIVESSDDAIISKTLDGVIQSWNAGAHRLFGWSAEEAIGRSITLIVPAERLDEEQHILDTLRRGGRIDHFETTRVTKDGRRVEISLTVSPIRNAAGTVVGASKIARDISNRKRNEGLLRQQESALQQAHAELQSRMRDLTRFNELAVGRELRILELKSEVNALREQLAQGPRYSLEFDGEPRAPTGVETQELHHEEGLVPLEAILRTDELSARARRPPDHQAENRALTTLVQALSDSPRSILQTLAEMTLETLRAGSAGLSLLTEDGSRFYWAAIAGQWSPHRGGGTPRRFGPCGDVLDCDAPLLFTHWERRYPYLAEATPLAEEGLLVPFHVGGKAVGTIWVIAHELERKFDQEDLRLLESLARFASAAYQATEYLNMLEQRRAALNLLEDAVQAQALVEESNRKLRKSEEELLESDRRKNEFLALLGHELRNPLSPISTASELLSRTVAGEPRARFAIGMIKRQTAQLTRLVDDLLDIGRITQGRIQLRRKPIDLARVIAQAIETIEPQLRERKHTLSVMASTSDGPLYVNGDLARLVQCVGNILANAAKYTEGGGEISVRTYGNEHDAFVEISDNGTGISAELLPRIFDLFVQSERTLDRSQGGLGIGLSIVKRLIDMHEGEVTARSPGLGQGSTFQIRLPRIERSEPIRLEAPPFQAPSRRVLIVDDNTDAATSLAMLLSCQGHQAEAAHSAREALEKVESLKPEIVLLDIGLPVMNGYQLAKRLRALPKLSGLRLIALTGYGQTDDRQRSLAAGFDDHLVKPVDLRALERAMAGLPRGADPPWDDRGE